MFIALLSEFVPKSNTSGKQFYINNTGKMVNKLYNAIESNDCHILPVLEEGYSGKDINVHIICAGAGLSHEKFTGRVNEELNYNFINDNNNPYVEGKSKDGTGVLGIIGAANSETGPMGIAYGAKLSATAVDGMDSKFIGRINELLSKGVDVIGKVNTENSRPLAQSFRYNRVIEELLKNITTKGRNGKGAIYIVEIGRKSLDTGIDGSSNPQTNFYESLVVGQTSVRGEPVYNIEASSSVLVSVTGTGQGTTMGTSREKPGIHTTDVSDGFETNFTGSKVTVGIMSGIIALILEANPNLTYRDVQLILALTAQPTDPTNPLWMTNAAGYKYSRDFGYGRVDCKAAIDAAKTWKNKEGTKERIKVKGTYNVTGGNTRTTTIEFEVKDSKIKFNEFVAVEFNMESGLFDSCRMILVSPMGTNITIAHPFVINERPPEKPLDGKYRIGCRAFLGEDPNGKWKIVVHRDGLADKGAIKDIVFEMVGLTSKEGIPKFEKRPASDLTKNFNISDKTKVIIDEELDITKEISMVLTNTVNLTDLGNLLTFWVQDRPYQRKYDIGIFHVMANEKFILPEMPVYKDKTRMVLIMREDPPVNPAYKAEFTMRNNKSGVLSPKRFEVIKVDDNAATTTVTLKWARQDTMVEPNFRYSLLDLYDAKKKKRVLSKIVIENGIAQLTLNTVDLPEHAVFSISPLTVGEYSPCKNRVFPVIFNHSSKPTSDKSFEE